MKAKKLQSCTGKILALCAVQGVFITTKAEAQSSPQEGEIIVTAQKRGAQTLLDTPIAVTAYSGEELDRRNVRAMADFLQQTPGVSLDIVNEGNVLPQIRGVSTGYGDATVGYYLDDLPFTLVSRPYVPDVAPFDLARVEVLRGPQGTLFGASSEGGTIRIITNDADPRAGFTAKGVLTGQLTDSSFGYGAQAAINVPIVSDTLAIRLVGGYQDLPGFIDNPKLGVKDWNPTRITFGRAKLTWLPTDQLKVRASYWYNRNKNGAGTQADDNFENFSPVAEVSEDTRLNLYNVAIEYTPELMDVYSTSSLITYKRDSITDFQGGTFGGFPFVDYRAFNQEIRLASKERGALRWTAGAFYLNAKDTQQGTIAAINFVGGDVFKSEQWAAFGELHYLLADDRLELTAGARYFEDKRSIVDFGTSCTLATQFNVDCTRRISLNDFAPKISVSFKPDRETLFYATASKGYRSAFLQLGISLGLANAFGFPAPVDVPAEALWSYEVGGKLRRGNWSLESAIYYIDWKNLQTQIDTGVGILYFDSVGSAHSAGVDLGVTYATRSLRVSLAGNLNEAQYDEDLPGARLKKGDRIIYVPSYNVTLSGNYSHPIAASGLKAVMSGEITAIGKKQALSGNTFYHSDAVQIANARIGLEKDQWQVNLFVNNLLDERGAIGPRLPNTFQNQLLANRARPRTVGLTLQLNTR